ncbi:MAG: cyclodeaminase/cyclohydrolase family protein [Armatimonadota bacterium]
MLEHKSVASFLDELASTAPAPGGGAASALVGAVGAALVSMVCGLTLASDKYKDSESVLRPIFERADNLRAELLKLAEDDANAFGKVSTAMKMPRATQEQKAARTAALQASLKDACDVPLRIMRACAETLALCEPAAVHGTPHAVSDIGVAVHCASAALRGAEMNVAVNLSLIKDSAYVETARAQADELLFQCQSRTDAVLAIVKGRM